MLYSLDKQKVIKKKLIKCLIINIISFLIALGVIVPTAFFINDKTLGMIQAIDCVIFSLFVCILIYSIVFVVLPLFRFNKTILNINASSESFISYQKAVKGKLKTIDHTEKVFIIELIDGDESYLVYLDSRYENLFDDISKHNKVAVRNNYIVEIL